MNTSSVFYTTAKLTISVIAAVALTACSSGGDTVVPEPQPEPPPKPAPPTVNQAKTFDGPLAQPGATQVSRYLKNGVYSSTLSGIVLETTDSLGGPAPSLASAGRISDTNTQVNGVDEANRIEYDGNYLYVATFPEWIEGEQEPASIRILQRNEDYSLSQIQKLVMEKKDQTIEGMYLANNRIAALGATYGVFPLGAISIEPWLTHNGKVDIDIYDTTIPAQTSQMTSMQIDGWLLGSRRIDQQLYVITSYVPTVDKLEPGEQSDGVLVANYQAIEETPTEQLMPHITIDGTESPLNAPQDCYIPELATEQDGYAQLMTVTRINLQQPQEVESVCLSVKSFMVYMSHENLYLAGDLERNTVFHKVQLSDLSYQATGSVEGQIGWRGAPNLRVDERDGYFRVVSTDYSGDEPVHSLSVLSQQGTRLDTVARLPNDNQPEPIGKPGEDVYAVRFFEDKAYVVTFERIDPLYVINTSDPVQPFVEGSLEIPGFSSYLHPLENGFLLGVGQLAVLREPIADPDETDDGSADTDADSPPPPVSSGLKISLFDVRDPQQPVQVNAIVKEQAFTPVEFDYKALSVTLENGKYQFAFPMEQWGHPEEDIPGESAKSGVARTSIAADVRNSLLMLEANTSSANPQLVEVGQLLAPDSGFGFGYVGNDRSVIHGEHVYYIHGNEVWHGMWKKNDRVKGPY